MLQIKKTKRKPKKQEVKNDDNEIRPLTKEEKTYMKDTIPILEEHERMQLYNFLKMDKVSYTEKEDGVLLNLQDANEQITFQMYKYIQKCVENQKYRKFT